MAKEIEKVFRKVRRKMTGAGVTKAKERSVLES